MNPHRKDAVKLVAGWIAIVREPWPPKVDAEPHVASNDAIVNATQRLRSMSEGTAGPLREISGKAIVHAARSKMSDGRGAHPAGHLAKLFAKRVLNRCEAFLGIDWTVPPLCSLSMTDVLRWAPGEVHQHDAILGGLAGEAARLFGFSPLASSGHVGLVSTVDSVHTSMLFRTPDRELFGFVARWRRQLEAAWEDDDSGGFLLDHFRPAMPDFGEAAAPRGTEEAAAAAAQRSAGAAMTPQGAAELPACSTSTLA